MDPSILRPATLADLAQVTSWIASVADCELWAGCRVSFPITMTALTDQISFAPTTTFSLVDEDCLLGFGQLVAKANGRGHLARLIVHPDHRGQGHGDALVRALIDLAVDQRFAPISLNVYRANGPAVALYRKVGFAEVPRPPDEPDLPETLYMEWASR